MTSGRFFLFNFSGNRIIKQKISRLLEISTKKCIVWTFTFACLLENVHISIKSYFTLKHRNSKIFWIFHDFSGSLISPNFLVTNHSFFVLCFIVFSCLLFGHFTFFYYSFKQTPNEAYFRRQLFQQKIKRT